MRAKIPELAEALTGRFGEHHAFLVRLYLDQYDQLTSAIDQLTSRIEEAMSPFRPALQLLDSIPGINQAVAEVIIAETGGDMARFTSAKHLASWAGVCPGALVAIEHSIITAIWHMLTDHKPYHDLGGTYFTQRDPERATRRAITALNHLGYTVTLNPMDSPA
jgi:hypothetical protein